MPEIYPWRTLNAAPFTSQFRSRQPEVLQKAAEDKQIFDKEIDLESITARVYVDPGSIPQFNPSKVLELVFSTFDPHHIGVVDYHGPHRLYGRETLQNINVSIESSDEQRRQSALYNYNSKYGNVKSEMAAAYVKEALAAKAGYPIASTADLTNTLKELFSDFFPHKEFLGPQADGEGSLRFPVRVEGSEVHDLDELSSGEKEILYGYLRLRSSAPRNSVILLDEPELHLNPKLTRKLATFYHRHLATALGDQIWLITHSDAILRDSVGRKGFSVFHVTPIAYAADARNQAQSISVDMELEKAIIDLVGDLASYTPGGRVVIFEGEHAEFDLWMTSELFPELAETANLISGTNKVRVRGLHGLLESLVKAGRLPGMEIYSIVDQDDERGLTTSGVRQARWDAYHIENFLLEPKYLFAAIRSIVGPSLTLKEEDVESELTSCAADTINKLVLHSIQSHVNDLVVGAAEIRVSPLSRTIGQDYHNSIKIARERIDELAVGALSEVSLNSLCEKILQDRREELRNGTWRKTFRGRLVLKRFVERFGSGAKYEYVRHATVDKMRHDGYRPAGMKIVIDPLLTPRSVRPR